MALEGAQVAFTVFNASHFYERTEKFAGHVHRRQIREGQDHFGIRQEVVPRADLHAPPYIIRLADDEDHRVIPQAFPQLFRVLHGRQHLIGDGRRIGLEDAVFLLFPQIVFRHDEDIRLDAAVRFQGLADIAVALGINLDAQMFLFIKKLSQSVVDILRQVGKDDEMAFRFISPLRLFLLALRLNRAAQAEEQDDEKAEDNKRHEFLH